MFAVCYDLLYVVQPHQLLEAMYFFIAVMAVVILFIAFYVVNRAGRSSRREQLRGVYSEWISQLAICEGEEELQQTTDDVLAQMQSSRLAMSRFGSDILIKELVTAAKSISGTAGQNISYFYTKAGLDRFSLERLKSGFWHIKASAIQTLAQLNQKQYITKIYRHANHPNELVRNEARVAVVKLTGFEGLRFLDVISYPLTEWEQLCLLHELAEHHHPNFKDIPDWLHSDNDSVVEFALALVESYRIYDLHGDVAFCLAHQQPFIRKKAVRTLGAINQQATAGLLVSQLQKEEEEVQLIVLEVMGKTGTENELPVLWPFLSHPHTPFKIAAARAIRNSHPYGLMLLQQRVNKEEYPWHILLPQLEEEVNA